MYSPFRHIGHVFRKGRPIHLTYFVTRRCNSRCPFCFYLRSDDALSEAGPELSLPEVEQVSRSLGNLLWLAFSGGEIFLRNDLAEIATTFYRNTSPAIMLFPTNGLLSEVIRDRMEAVLRACPKSIIALKLSLDGVGAAHDGVRNTPGSFERTMETYRKVLPLIEQYGNLELGINTVFCSENQSTMDEIIDFVAGLSAVRTHTISLVRGNLQDKQFGSVDMGKYHDAVLKLEKNLQSGKSPVYRFRGGRLKAAQDILQRRLIHRIMTDKKRLIPCYAGRLNLVLSESGDVYPCEILTSSFGNVREFEYDIRKVLRSGNARRVNASIMNNECYCTHECYFMTNILFNPRLAPALLKEYFALRPR